MQQHPPLTDQSNGTVIVTILDEDLRACEASMNGCHVQGALPFFALWRVKNKTKTEYKTILFHLKCTSEITATESQFTD